MRFEDNDLRKGLGWRFGSVEDDIIIVNIRNEVRVGLIGDKVSPSYSIAGRFINGLYC